MTLVNFIFKNNQYINGIGGKLPSNEDPSINVHIKSNKGYYYLAETEDINIQKLNKWEPMIVSDQVARGFPLLNATQVYDESTDSMRNLTTQEKEDQHTAEKVLKKIELRSQIHGQIGDINDLVADLSKRLGLLERITMRTLDFVYNNSSMSGEIPQAFKDNYGVLMSQYLSDINNGYLRDRVDIEDNTEIYNKLSTRFNIITDLVETYLNY